MKMNIGRLISAAMYSLVMVFYTISEDFQTSILLALWVIVLAIWSVAPASNDNKNDN